MHTKQKEAKRSDDENNIGLLGGEIHKQEVISICKVK
jgi:hypothetical protein